MPLADDDLKAIVFELFSRPKHEKVRSLVYKLLTNGLGIRSADITFEQQIEVRGRIDALLGSTVFEFKSDLRAEIKAVLNKLPEYLSDREAASGRKFIGIATDGHDFLPYRLRDGQLEALTPFSTPKDKPDLLLGWLSGAVSVSDELKPTSEIITRELGKESLAYDVARLELRRLWASIDQQPAAKLKRDVWARLLEKVYGSRVDTDDLFFQHTYLTIVAKAMALQVLGIPRQTAKDLLDGTPFQNAGIAGAVESDFFDWVLDTSDGAPLIDEIAAQVFRFRLDHVEHDVLKDLYESLIDPAQRHDLGEYYTPDWLASEVHANVVTSPLEQRVLDPSCGSGTFLFHAVRAVLAAADTRGLKNADAIELCTNKVIGIDIHPVAVIIARVVYLMAIGEKRLQNRNAISIPVYLGDSVQWNTQTIMTHKSVRIDVPASPDLVFPASAASDPHEFNSIVANMLQYSATKADPNIFSAWLHNNVTLGDQQDYADLIQTYTNLRKLYEDERNHIWGYVARNLARPIWLSSDLQQVDCIVGNPPWLSFRYMTEAMQDKFRADAGRLGVTTFGQGSSSQQELSTYFFARCVELYLKVGGRIGFVLPFSVMQGRKQYSKFLTGSFQSITKMRKSSAAPGRKGKSYPHAPHLYAEVRFDEGWALTDKAKPIFKVPSCVLFATKGERGPLPDTLTDFEGILPRRDATREEARRALHRAQKPWSLVGAKETHYGTAFRAGAIIFPVALFRVQPVKVNPLGGNVEAPEVESRRSSLEKEPWKSLVSLRGPIERTYLRRLLLGDNVAPFVCLEPSLCVLPYDEERRTLLDSAAARDVGALHLSRWLQDVETLWKKHAKTPSESIVQRLDYYHQLSSQFPISPIRLVYTASGTNLVAAIQTDTEVVIEHKLYWGAMETMEEARYLEGVLNSETTRKLAEKYQSRGQWGARDFDKVAFKLRIPPYTGDPQQLRLIDLATHAERVAANVLSGSTATRSAATRIARKALLDNGIAIEIDNTVTSILERTQE